MEMDSLTDGITMRLCELHQFPPAAALFPDLRRQFEAVYCPGPSYVQFTPYDGALVMRVGSPSAFLHELAHVAAVAMFPEKSTASHHVADEAAAMVIEREMARTMTGAKRLAAMRAFDERSLLQPDAVRALMKQALARLGCHTLRDVVSWLLDQPISSQQQGAA